MEDRVRALEQEMELHKRWRDGDWSRPGAEKRLSLLEWQFSFGRWIAVVAGSAIIVAVISAIATAVSK